MDGEYILLGEDGAPFLDPVKPKAYIVSGKSWVNNHAHVLRAKPCLASNRFVLFALNATDYVDFVNGTTRLKLTQGALKSIPIRLPPLREQERIVAAIETQFTRLDAAVAGLKGVQAKLKRYRAAVLKAAVEGTLTEAWRAGRPDIEPAPELLGRILQERRDAWEQAELAKYARSGKTPPKGWQAKYKEPAEPDMSNLPQLLKGWCWATMQQTIARSEYGTSVKCDYSAEGAPVLRIPNIAAGEIDLTDLKFATQALPLDAASALQAGDMLMCRTNGSVSLIGKAALIRTPLEPYHAFASYLLRFRLVEPTVLPNWLHLYVSSMPGRTFIEGNAASSAGQHNISLSLMHGMVFPLPSLAEQERIVAEVERRLSVVAETEAQVAAELKRAERLRQSILAQAFAGQLVPQDPEDEPVSALLERLRAQWNGTTAKRQGQGLTRHAMAPYDKWIDAKNAEERQLTLICPNAPDIDVDAASAL